MMRARLLPTANGPLHIGHVYNALVNKAESDELVLRHDDSQTYWVRHIGHEALQQNAASQLRDLEWMGFEFVEVAYNSRMEEIVLRESARSPHYWPVPDHWAFDPKTYPQIISSPRIEAWGATFHDTAEKVILDHEMGINVMVRGLELVQENALYCYYCGIFGYPIPLKMYYIPRLMAYDGSELTDISKTAGNWKVQDLRASGVTQEEILTVLRHACLLDPTGGWGIDNLKGQPALTVDRLRKEWGDRHL